jgi:peptidyl-prolyl cis-trans isomerase C
MKALSFVVFLCVSTAWTQSSPPSGDKGEAIIAVFEDGGKLTLDEFKGLLQIHPSWQKLPREQAIHEYAILRKAASLAQEKRLNEKSPYKEALDFDIMYKMAEAWAQNATDSITVQSADIEKYYNEHKGPFQLFKVSGIKVAFGGSATLDNSDSPPLASKPPQKVMTEEEAKAKAGKLLAEIRGGAEFRKVALLESDDVSSKTKGGELGTWGMADNIPGDLRAAVLSLKEGEVSEPVHQPGGYWLVHVDTITYRPLTEVRDVLFEQLKQERVHQMLQDFDRNTKVAFPQQNQPLPPQAPPDPKK